jgi:hypothetical protein
MMIPMILKLDLVIVVSEQKLEFERLVARYGYDCEIERL